MKFSVNIHACIEVDEDSKEAAIVCALQHLQQDGREHICDIQVSVPAANRKRPILHGEDEYSRDALNHVR